MDRYFTVKRTSGVHVVIDREPIDSWNDELCTVYADKQGKIANKITAALNFANSIEKLNIGTKTTKKELVQIISLLK